MLINGDTAEIAFEELDLYLGGRSAGGSFSGVATIDRDGNVLGIELGDIPRNGIDKGGRIDPQDYGISGAALFTLLAAAFRRQCADAILEAIDFIHLEGRSIRAATAADLRNRLEAV